MTRSAHRTATMPSPRDGPADPRASPRTVASARGDAPDRASVPGSSAALARAAPLRLRRLTARHATALVALRARVLATLAHPDFYVAEADEAGFIARHRGARGAILGFFAGETLVAYGMVRLPDAAGAAHVRDTKADPTAGHRWDASARERLPELSSCMVDPAWRGRGLQRRLIAARLRWGRRRAATRFWAVVSPHNAASRHNLRKAGFRVIATADVDGHHRLVMGWEDAGAIMGAATVPATVSPAVPAAPSLSTPA